MNDRSAEPFGEDSPHMPISSALNEYPQSPTISLDPTSHKARPTQGLSRGQTVPSSNTSGECSSTPVIKPPASSSEIHHTSQQLIDTKELNKENNPLNSPSTAFTVSTGISFDPPQLLNQTAFIETTKPGSHLNSRRGKFQEDNNIVDNTVRGSFRPSAAINPLPSYPLPSPQTCPLPSSGLLFCRELTDLPQAFDQRLPSSHIALPFGSELVDLPEALRQQTISPRIRLPFGTELVDVPETLRQQTLSPHIHLHFGSKLIDLPKDFHPQLPLPRITPPFGAELTDLPRGFHPQSPSPDIILPFGSTLTDLPQGFGQRTPSPQIALPFHSEFNESVGMADLIEQMHNVQARNERPTKRLRTETTLETQSLSLPMKFTDRENFDLSRDLEKSDQPSDNGTSRSMVPIMDTTMSHPTAKSIEKWKEDLEYSSNSADVVDLTGDDNDTDNDDVIIITNKRKQKDPEEAIVCYGRVEDAQVVLHTVPTPSRNAVPLTKANWPTMAVDITRYPTTRNVTITVTDPTGQAFGTVDPKTAAGLAPLMDNARMKLRVQARLPPRKRKEGETPGQQCSAYLPLHVNLYGMKRDAREVGALLSQKRIWLRTPFASDAGIDILNPHDKRNTALGQTPGVNPRSSVGGHAYITRTIEEVRNDVMGVFDSLGNTDKLPGMEPPSIVLTPLLRHQKQALHFMTEKEKEYSSDVEREKISLWKTKSRRDGSKVFFNIITGKEERTRPAEPKGGLLADVMGLGKTLSILSLVASTFKESATWGERKPPPPQSLQDVVLLRNSKTTLLIAPLSTVTNWEEQIVAHLKKESLSYHIYHGSPRTDDVHVLAQYDMVITTYSTVSSDWMGKKGISPLFQTNWFRIVLDEAHMIREQGTRQSQAACSLSAQRRWAVTGTPVQNRLDDLGALLKFLRIKPFDDRGGFTQFILSPFKIADPEILPKLRVLVDSITLRRLKDRITLPPRFDQRAELEFSPDEKALYVWFEQDISKKMKAMFGVQKRQTLGGKSYVHVLKAILRLRLVSAHGKDLLSEEDLKIAEGFSRDNAITLDDDEEIERPSLSEKQAYDMLDMMESSGVPATCVNCSSPVRPKEIGEFSDEESSSKDEVLGYMMECYNVICKNCISSVKALLESKIEDGNMVHCPFCDISTRLSFFELTQSGFDLIEKKKTMQKDSPTKAKMLARYEGPHTKTQALLDSLIESQKESQAHPDALPIKSVVFSQWTRHLDLIEIAFDYKDIGYTRLDGSMPRIARNKALEAFRDDPKITVILVSINAGGLGLNLTAASKVYVMEPQYNPAAEAQAVERVHRLGQKRPVTITRFIMKNSFEERMVELQEKKLKLAEMSMNRGKVDNVDVARSKLQEIRSLFK
ncbi:MAG: hypothetical protein M1834_005348 [Cirrosporium novae-zelandiae]|nr:MAG: hypothetical protein M1834_005348 [Cirrosporium novae-zelandiae]